MQIKVSDYIARRLLNLGIDHVFGLPGDFNFNILDSVIQAPGLTWVNCTNELNAAYAADGYARINGYGAVVTTFGVGELSAINGIAGAYAENLPVIKIAGVPKTQAIKSGALLHHNFSNPDYFAFEKVYSNVTAATAYLDNENTIKSEIDRVFDIFIKEKKPVYIALPVDVCNFIIDDTIPETIIKSDPVNLKNAADKITELINNSKNPLIITDYLMKRFRLQNEVRSIVEKFNIKITSMIMGKGLIEEDDRHFIGMNFGEVAEDDYKEVYQDFDLIIGFGTLFSDLNTLGFAVKPDERFKIEIQTDYVIADGERFENVYIIDIINTLLNSNSLQSKNPPASNIPYIGYKPSVPSDKPIVLDEVFPLLQDFLEENDTVIIETGIISFASSKMKLKKGSNYLSQTLWGSIGWATPAAFGASVADKSKRTVLFTGEGSHQLTVQELSNMFKYDIKPVILVLNNSGYTIERYLSNDPNDVFNDITNWNYKKALELFGKHYKYHSVKTSNDLNRALNAAKEEQKDNLVYIEIFADKMDIPEIMKKSVAGVKK